MSSLQETAVSNHPLRLAQGRLSTAISQNQQPTSLVLPWIFACAEYAGSRKLLGERAECAFLYRAMEQGLIVSKPYGDSAPYDFVVERPRLNHRGHRGKSGLKAKANHEGHEGHKGKLWKIQVKSAWERDGQGRYLVHTCRSGSRAYAAGEVDCFAAWVEPQDAWYLIPAAAVTGTCVHLYPQRPNSRGRHEKYREAWQLLIG